MPPPPAADKIWPTLRRILAPTSLDLFAAPIPRQKSHGGGARRATGSGLAAPLRLWRVGFIAGALAPVAGSAAASPPVPFLMVWLTGCKAPRARRCPWFRSAPPRHRRRWQPMLPTEFGMWDCRGHLMACLPTVAMNYLLLSCRRRKLYLTVC